MPLPSVPIRVRSPPSMRSICKFSTVPLQVRSLLNAEHLQARQFSPFPPTQELLSRSGTVLGSLPGEVSLQTR